MMRKASVKIILCMALLLPLRAVAGVSITEPPSEYSCRDVDLAGAFSMVAMTETPTGEEAAWAKDYHFQYYNFRQDHTYGFVASRHKLMKLDDLENSIHMATANNMTPLVNKYELDESGILKLYSNDRLDYTYRCMVLNKPKGVQLPGDIELKGYSKQNTLLDKFLRRWPQ